MKRWTRDVLSAWVAMCAITLVGCASAPTDEPPPMPAFETEQQMAAAHDCQAVYSCCTRACQDSRNVHNVPTPSDDACLSACRNNLGQCYRACE